MTVQVFTCLSDFPFAMITWCSFTTGCSWQSSAALIHGILTTAQLWLSVLTIEPERLECDEQTTVLPTKSEPSGQTERTGQIPQYSNGRIFHKFPFLYIYILKTSSALRLIEFEATSSRSTSVSKFCE